MFDSQDSLLPPIPGTTPPPHALFVDRWGTLLETPERGFARTPDEVRFLPGAVEALFRAVRAGWRIYLLGNEDAVADGKLSAEAWEAVEERILSELRGAGVMVARQYACLTRPDGSPGRVGDSVYLLPNTGAFYHAAHSDGIELRRSWVIGDSTVELVAGWRSGCRMASVRTGLALADRTFEVDPEIVGEDLARVVEVLLERARVSA
jgi:histidinol phosphatase-like enzyme